MTIIKMIERRERNKEGYITYGTYGDKLITTNNVERIAEGGGVEGRGWYATQTSTGDDTVDTINNRRKYPVQ